MEKFSMNLPTGYVNALNNRHNGRKLDTKRVAGLKERMDLFWLQYSKAKKSLDKLWIFWVEQNVEDHFMQPKWYNAHSRRKKHELAMLKNHRSMFYVLLEADGNSESFNQHWCISAEEIKEDFYRKYINKKG